MADRREVLAFASQHGAAAAAAKFGVSAGTIRSWRSRARKRSGRSAAAPGPDNLAHSPAGQYLQAAQRIVEWASGQGPCLRCGGAGYLSVNTPEAVARVPALGALRHAKRITCPDCGGPERGAVVVGTNTSVEARALAADRGDVAADERQHPQEARVWRYSGGRSGSFMRS